MFMFIDVYELKLKSNYHNIYHVFTKPHLAKK